MPSKYRPLPDLAILQEHFQVVPINTLGVDSGLIWVKPTSAIRRPGDVAGCLSSHSKQADRQDWKLCFNYTKYYVSRIIYALHHGVDPAEQTVDHIDRNPLNNAVENLALVGRDVQNRNRRVMKNNTSGLRGVTWASRSQSWTAQIGLKGDVKRLGCYRCKVKAAEAYNNALLVLCPERYDKLKNNLAQVSCDCRTCTNPPSANNFRHSSSYQYFQ